MFRDILTNRWILGGVAFLIVFAVACVFWYQYDTADDRKAAAEAEEMLRQSQAAKKVSDTDSGAGQAADVTSAASVESYTPTTRKPTTKRELKDATSDKTSATLTQQTQATNKKVHVSPYGFGPYPELPPGFPEDYWDKRIGNRDNELLARVRIKLVEQGKNVTGAGMLNGLVYPTIPGTIYVEWKWNEVKKERYVGLMMGDPFTINSIPGHLPGQRLREKDMPAGIEVINYLNGGIDPYQFLDLKE